MRPRGIVFDLFGEYLRYRGGQASLQELTALLDVFGVAPGTTRVVMARLRKEGWFETRQAPSSREVIYQLTPRSLQMLNEGRERVFAPPPLDWDGVWRMVIYYVPESERALREELRKELAWLGFGPLAASTWMSPHARLDLVEEKFADRPGLRLDLLTARSRALEDDRDIASRCWDIEALNADYAEFLAKHRGKLAEAAGMTASQALVARTEVMYDYRKFPFRDPQIPPQLLPERWLGREAYELFTSVREALSVEAARAIDERAARAEHA